MGIKIKSDKKEGDNLTDCIVLDNNKRTNKEIELDLGTGKFKQVRKLSTIDWLLKYLEIEFKVENNRTTATVTNAYILENGTDYEISGTGELANDAVKALAEDIRGEVVKVYTDTVIEYYVTDKLEFIRRD